MLNREDTAELDMIISQKTIDQLLAEMQAKGLASTAGAWLEKAVQRKVEGLSVGVAASRLLVYDRLDRFLALYLTSN